MDLHKYKINKSEIEIPKSEDPISNCFFALAHYCCNFGA